MSELSSPWRVERACLAAWPALERQETAGWTARFSQGFTRRANSANPSGPEIHDLDSGVAAVEALYRARGLPAIFRVPTLVDPAIDKRLENFGYAAEGAFSTLHGPIELLTRRDDEDVEFSARPGAEWLAAQNLFQARTPEQGAIYARIVGALEIPAVFAGLRREGALVALAYGALHDGLLCVESAVTAKEERGRGCARRLLAALFARAERMGARELCLQVEAANEPALRLYESLGLRTELYRYRYRRKPDLTE